MGQNSHKGNVIAITKNGSQQITKAPVIMANVLAAFRSRLASNVSLRLLTFFKEFATLPKGIVVLVVAVMVAIKGVIVVEVVDMLVIVVVVFLVVVIIVLDNSDTEVVL